MITIRRAQDRGQADHGWLQANHTFSFAQYIDPQWMGFGHLRVLNQDRIQPGQGFGAHSHADMEIVTYVLEGALEHQDSMGNGSKVYPGEVQLMSAGTGVTHSEFNSSNSEELHLLQMWIEPDRDGYEPRYEQQVFSTAERTGIFKLVVSPDGRNGSLTIRQDASLYVGLLDGDQRAELTLPAGRMAWFHLARGAATLSGNPLEAGDGVAIHGPAPVLLTEGDSAEFVLWDLPQSH